METQREVESDKSISTGSDDEVPLSLSKNIHEGVAVDNPEITIKPVVAQKRNYVTVNGSRKNEHAEITQDSIRRTVQSDRAGNKSQYRGHPYLSNDMIRDEPSGIFLVQREDSGSAPYAVCSLKYAVTVKFTDDFGKTHEFRKTMTKKKDAESLKKRFEGLAASGNLECWYENGNYRLGDKKLRVGMITLAFGLFAGGIGTLFFSSVQLLQFLGLFVTFIAGVKFIDMVVELLETYFKDGYSKTWRLSTGDDDVAFLPDATDAEYKAVTVKVEQEEDRVLFTTDKIDSVWTYECPDGILPEEVIEFYEELGFDYADKKNLHLTATTTKKEHETVLESDDGQWYLLPES